MGHVSDELCKERREPIMAFMADWNKRWNVLTGWIIINLLALLFMAIIFIWRTSTIKMISTVQAEQSQTKIQEEK